MIILLKSIKEKFNKPVIIESFISNKLNLSFSYGLFIFTFLTLFKPFKLDLLKHNFFGYSIVISILYSINLLLLLFLLKKINYKKWTISHLIIWYGLFIFCLGFVTWYFSGLYKDFVNYSLKLPFLRFLKYTLFVSLVSTPLLILLNDKITKNKKIKKTVENTLITIYSENKKEKIKIDILKLIYITISGNYVSFYIIEETQIKELILRNTLSNILSQIKKYPTIFKCHKSYIINSLHINAISGNAKGYFLISNMLTNKIPVSRSFNNEELENLLQKKLPVYPKTL